MKKLLIKIIAMMLFVMAFVLGFSRLILFAISTKRAVTTAVSYHVSLISGFCGLILFAALLCIFIGRRLNKLKDGIKKVAKGDYETTFCLSGNDELADLAAALNKMTKELRANEYLSKEFVKNVSHEFKTPLSAIIGYGDLLKTDEITDKDRKEYASIICDEARKLNKMSMKMLAISRLDHTENIVHKEYFNADELVRDVVLALQPTWSANNLCVEAELEELPVFSDKTLFRLIVQNLFSNAVKYTDDGGFIRIETKKKNSRLIFSVENSSDALKGKENMLFRPFCTAGQPREKGTGLGLTLARKATEKLGGTLVAECGKTALFRANIPLCEDIADKN